MAAPETGWFPATEFSLRLFRNEDNGPEMDAGRAVRRNLAILYSLAA
jgi:hypothetical protein